MGVPAHCDNDKAFAFKNNIQSLDVLNEDDQTLINSGAATGLSFEQAKWYIMAQLGHDVCKKTTEYRLRDWLVSRQRYWGVPFPIVFDDQGDMYALESQDLPVNLPTISDPTLLKIC